MQEHTRKSRPQISNMAFGKVPPQVPELEKAIIAACLLEREALTTAMGVIPSGDCFYVDRHQIIYEAMLHMNKSGMPIDLLTVQEELKRRGQLDLVGGYYELTQLSQAVMSAAHVEAHCYMVLEKHFAREVIRISGAAITEAYNDSTDIFDLLDHVKQSIVDITKNLGSSDVSVGRLYMQMLSELNEQRQNEVPLTGCDTGLTCLNEITNGWQNQDLIIIGARPSKGKTALALNLAYSAAISTLVQKVPVGIFSLEMGAIQLVKRMASTVSGVEFGKLVSAKVGDSEFLTLSNQSKKFNLLPIRLNDKAFTLLKIEAQAKKWAEKDGIKLIIIDYLQLIKGDRVQGGNREQEISGISRRLKLLAKELNLPIILLSQLNRGVESRRESPEPMPSDLRESGAIEQDADVILFPWHTDEGAKISVSKNRNGKTATKENSLDVVFSGSIQKWMDKDAFDSFAQPNREAYIRDNPRAGIHTQYPSAKPQIDEDAPF